jgi:hypothetical protein
MESNNSIPKITTRETEQLRSVYPNISHLEAGDVAGWLTERKDQLLIQAQTAETEADTTRVLGLAAAGIGTICYAVNPFMLIGGMIGGAAWLWFVVAHYNRTKEIAPLPFVRGNFLDALARMGDADLRGGEQNHLAETIKFLPRAEAGEYVFLYSDFFEVTVDYLTQVEPGKRFYAYRWLLTWFEKTKGRSLPGKSALEEHLKTVTVDSRVKPALVKAIQKTTVNRFIDLPKPNIEELPQLSANAEPAVAPSPQALANLPIEPRAIALINAMLAAGFKVDQVMGSQLIAIAGSQRGGKGTLAAILTILLKAENPAINAQYFTAGVDVYPFACTLTSALKYSGRDADMADGLVAEDLLRFLKGLDGCEPYSYPNLLLVIDEAMRLLSLMEEADRIWALQFLLSRFAKTGATLIIVLHASNLSSIAGKATAGLAATFKEAINFIGCSTQSVSLGGLRKINIASGAYFQANPDNFGTPLFDGDLGVIPAWLKVEKHPGNGQPDPARSLLTFFPELSQEHRAATIPQGEKLASMDAVTQLENVLKIREEATTIQPEKEISQTAKIILLWLQANRPGLWVKYKGSDRDQTFLNLLSKHGFGSQERMVNELFTELFVTEKIDIDEGDGAIIAL